MTIGYTVTNAPSDSDEFSRSARDRKRGSTIGSWIAGVLIVVMFGYGTAYIRMGSVSEAGGTIIRVFDVPAEVRVFTPAAFVEAKLRRRNVCIQNFLHDTDDPLTVYFAKP